MSIAGQNFHERCVRCYMCTKIITDSSINYQEKNFHAECAKCDSCHCYLEKQSNFDIFFLSINLLISLFQFKIDF